MKYYKLKCGQEFRFDGELSFDETGWSNCQDGQMKRGDYGTTMNWVEVFCVEFNQSEISVTWTM